MVFLYLVLYKGNDSEASSIGPHYDTSFLKIGMKELDEQREIERRQYRQCWFLENLNLCLFCVLFLSHNVQKGHLL
jgi:hypothetical protein